MTARAKAKNRKSNPMQNLNVLIPAEWHKWLDTRAARIPGLDKSDIVRMILKAERDREEVREGRK